MPPRPDCVCTALHFCSASIQLFVTSPVFVCDLTMNHVQSLTAVFKKDNRFLASFSDTDCCLMDTLGVCEFAESLLSQHCVSSNFLPGVTDQSPAD